MQHLVDQLLPHACNKLSLQYCAGSLYNLVMHVCQVFYIVFFRLVTENKKIGCETMALFHRLDMWSCLLFSVFCINLCTQEQLYYASIGPSDNKKGFYGGPNDISVNGTASNLTKSGVYCANMRSAGFYEGFDIRSMAYDPITSQAIIQMEVLSYTRTSAFTTKVCNSLGPKCKTAEINVIFAQADTRDKSKGNMGPFAMWNNSVYFLADRYERAPHRSIRHRIELRKLDGCETRYPFTMTNAIQLDDCSVFLATVAEEIGQDLGFEMEDTLLVGRHLKILSINGRLVFLTQVQNQTFNDVYDVEKFTMMLIAVGDSVPARVLYEKDLPDDFAEHEIPQIGGIDYKDGVLCWSMLDRILCGDWDGEMSIKNIKRVLPMGMSSKVCKGW